MKKIKDNLWHSLRTESVPSLFCGKCVREGLDSFTGYYHMGVLHRENGPAVEYIPYQLTTLDANNPVGYSTAIVKNDNEYWLFGRQRTEEEYRIIIDDILGREE